MEQGYDKGWVALQVQSSKFKTLEHVKVNSWANGWNVPEGQTVYILYWPQLLEWGGGVLGLTTLLVLILGVKRKWHQNT